MADKLPSSVDKPITPPKRPAVHLDRARALVGQGGGEPKKATIRFQPDHLEWLRTEAKGFKVRNPKKPRLTIEELLAVAIDHLREAKSLDAIVAKHRS